MQALTQTNQNQLATTQARPRAWSAPRLAGFGGALSLLSPLLILAACSGGGGGGGGSTAVEDPEVLESTPASGASDVAIDIVPTVRFNIGLDGSTVGAQSVRLEGSGGMVAGEASYLSSQRMVEFRPSTDLAFSTTYTLHLGEAIRGASGGAFSGISIQFTTARPPAPRVVSTLPAVDADDVTVTIQPLVVFDSPLAPATIHNESVSLTGPDGPAEGTALYLASTNAIEFRPTAELHHGAEYKLQLSSSILGANGTAILPFALSFETQQEAGDGPRVIATIPDANANEVGLNVAPKAIYDLTLDPATVHGGSVFLLGPSGPVPGSLLYLATENSVVFTPSSSLTPGQDYSYQLTSVVTGIDGQPAESFVLEFTTLAPPSIVSIDPADGATNVQRDSIVEILFDRAMDPASVHSGTIRLRDGSSTIPATVSLVNAGTTARLEPNEKLGMLRRYEVRIEPNVRSLSGIELGHQVRAFFTTEDGDWSSTSTQVMSLNNALDAEPQVALSENGAATGVLLNPDQNDLATGVRYEPQAGFPWQAPEPIDDQPHSRSARVAADEQGRALAVWENNGEIWVNRYANGWQAQTTALSGSQTQNSSPVIAMAEDGRAVVAWVREDLSAGNNRFNIAYRSFLPGGNNFGSIETVLQSDLSAPVLDLKLVLNNQGTAVVAFTLPLDDQYRIHATTALWLQGFQTAFPLDDTSLSRDDAIDITLAISDSVAVAAWIQDSQSCSTCGDWRNRLWVNRLEFSLGGWDGPQLADQAGNNSSHQPAIALTEKGDSAMLLWRQDAIGPDQLGTHRIDTTVNLTQGLGQPVMLDTHSGFGDAKPTDICVGLDQYGNGISVYRQARSVNEFDVYARRYIESEDRWSDALTIESLLASATRPSLSMVASGAAMVIWYAHSPSQSARVEANLFH